MEIYSEEWSKKDLKNAISFAFSYLEKLDFIVGFVCACPEVMKEIILAVPEDIEILRIPEGLGKIRTAYLKFKFGRFNEIIFMDQDKSISLKITLK